jgi:phospholipid-binding lipoprotein MlaA
MKETILKRLRAVFASILLVFVSGCATTGSGDPRDPFEGFNRGVYSFNETMDKIIFDPIGNVYKTITPDVVDRGVTNFFNNLEDISVSVNSFLQFKIDQALSSATRFIFNSTIGLFGFFDVSTGMGLPGYDEDFGQTLGYWGVGPGPFLMFPFFGPSTVRDATGFIADSAMNPIIYLDNTKVKAGLLTLAYIDIKSDLLSAKAILEEAAIDEYEFLKNAYFQKREAQIRDEAVLSEEYDTNFDIYD